jgi:hypothetical protein
MQFRTILSALFLAICACTPCIQQPSAPIRKVEVQTPTVPGASSLQTFSDKVWSLSLPRTFVRNPTQTSTWLDADDKTNNTNISFFFTPVDGNQTWAMEIIIRFMVSHQMKVKSISLGSFVGRDDAIVVAAEKETSEGTIYLRSWSSIIDDHIYTLGCIIFPTSPNVIAAEQVCDAAAASVKLTPLPLP